MWYGLKMGLSYEVAQEIPLSQLLDLISVHQIKEEGFRYQKPMNDEEELQSILLLR